MSNKQETWEIVAAPEFRNEYEGDDSYTKINDSYMLEDGATAVNDAASGSSHGSSNLNKPLDTEESTGPDPNSGLSGIGCSPSLEELNKYPSIALKSSTTSQNGLIYLNENHINPPQPCTGANTASEI